jgi:transcription antitermination factor NusG
MDLDSLEEKIYKWYVISIIKNRNSILNHLLSEETKGQNIIKVYIPTEDQSKKPILGYVYVKAVPGYLESIRPQHEKAFLVVGEVPEDEVKKTEQYFTSRQTSMENNISVGSKVKFINGNYLDFIGHIEEVLPNGEIEVKVWFMDTVTKIRDRIENVRLYKKETV